VLQSFPDLLVLRKSITPLAVVLGLPAVADGWFSPPRVRCIYQISTKAFDTHFLSPAIFDSLPFDKKSDFARHMPTVDKCDVGNNGNSDISCDV
jgi:hypothetical protein